MKFLNLLVPKEKIVGIEVSNQKLRMVYLRLDKNGQASLRGKSEVELEEGIISNGIVKDENKLSQAIAKLKKNFKPRKALSSFAVVTIPQNNIYSDIFEFPENLNGEQLMESVTLNVAENIPLPISQCYLDWQIVEKNSSKNKKRVLVSLISKEIADSYIKVLEENGFKLISLEPASLSIERAIEIPKDPTILLYLSDEGMTSVIYNNRYAYFSQFELWKELSIGKEIKNIADLNKIKKNKIRKLIAYFESGHKQLKIKKVLLMSCECETATIIKKMGPIGLPVEKARIKIKAIKSNDLIPVVGAAARAFTPRSDDLGISLLPVGTESFYEKQKAVSFVRSILVLFSTLAIFYVVTLSVAFTAISLLADDLNRQFELKSKIEISQEYAKIESETKEFNSYVKDLGGIYEKTDKNYISALKSLNKINNPGISLANASIEGSSGLISISGVASTRENLNSFKYQIENSNSFSNAEFLVANIAQKNNISFSATFHSEFLK